MNAVTTNAVNAITGGPPSSNATAAASPAQPSVATQRGYGWRARHRLGQRGGGRLDTHPLRAPPGRRCG